MEKRWIHHLCRDQDWAEAESLGVYRGSAEWRRDGFLHFSTGDQVRESAERHLPGVAGLVLLTVDPDLLGAALKWEESRSGDMFPHLYGDLPLDAVIRCDPLPLDEAGRHIFPRLD